MAKTQSRHQVQLLQRQAKSSKTVVTVRLQNLLQAVHYRRRNLAESNFTK